MWPMRMRRSTLGASPLAISQFFASSAATMSPDFFPSGSSIAVTVGDRRPALARSRKPRPSAHSAVISAMAVCRANRGASPPEAWIRCSWVCSAWKTGSAGVVSGKPRFAAFTRCVMLR